MRALALLAWRRRREENWEAEEEFWGGEWYRGSIIVVGFTHKTTSYKAKLINNWKNWNQKSGILGGGKDKKMETLGNLRNLKKWVLGFEVLMITFIGF